MTATRRRGFAGARWGGCILALMLAGCGQDPLVVLADVDDVTPGTDATKPDTVGTDIYAEAVDLDALDGSTLPDGDAAAIDADGKEVASDVALDVPDVALDMPDVANEDAHADADVLPGDVLDVGHDVLACEPSCILCSDPTTCTKCSAGFYVSNGNCLPCESRCATCENASTCLACISGSYLYQGNCFAGACPSGTFAQGTNCLECAENCDACTNAVACTKCATGFFNDAGTCAACEANCDVCSNATTCSTCSSGSYLYQGNCFAGSCPTGTYVSDPVNRVCSNCEGHCDACSDAATCTACSTSFYLYDGNCHAGVCPAGTYLDDIDDRICAACETDCSACISAATCTQCTAAHYLFQANCYADGCPSGSFLSDGVNRICSSCEANCTACGSSTACTACTSGYYLYQGNCHVGGCPSGSYLSDPVNRVCSVCEANCAACTSGTACTACASGYYLYQGNCHVGGCPSGTFLADPVARVCAACESGCAACSDAFTCTGCSAGYYLFAGNCFADACPEGSYLSDAQNRICSACEANCASCSSAVTCTACDEWYYLYQGDCFADACPEGSYLSDAPNRVCSGCETNCTACSSATVCTECADGYDLYLGDCLLVVPEPDVVDVADVPEATDVGPEADGLDELPFYYLEPPDPCYSRWWVPDCDPYDDQSVCGGMCEVANACSPPEALSKVSNYYNLYGRTMPFTFACPRFMMFSREMLQAAKDDTNRYGWGDPNDPPFVYGVVGHDPDPGGVDPLGSNSSCCRCYQLVFETPETASPQPPTLPYPKPVIVQSFNTASGGAKNFDLFMGAGGYGAYNACYNDPSFDSTSDFGVFMYSDFPSVNYWSGGVGFLRYPECFAGGGVVTMESLASSDCQGAIATACGMTWGGSEPMTEDTILSCVLGNEPESLYHQNWKVRALRVSCPENLTRVTGCRIIDTDQPAPMPQVKTPADAAAAGGFTAPGAYTTTTMQDCCKPSCAWADWVGDGQYDLGLTPLGDWRAFYSCDQTGNPFTTAF